MKRVVAITVIMVMVTSLFTFSVFADTQVQPLQVITYSDTTTNVRISGTAERLHYNVDSFQVVFMNPPNNYGTACTPVLVSFRFYNSSDLPAYVGQAEFELTATTSTGAVNTIIYGYDQISTDLFVAESSYSTAEVGRIGIGASNDFAYYTGFVIPPRTSLYFSCIVYVNASAYGQNNTGATEDVNQITLSALNLYTNQISFSADYPYHNQPIDFEPVIEAIQSLSDTVSTSSEMSDLISAVTYTGGNVTFNVNDAVISSYDNNSNENYRIIAKRIIGKSYLINSDFEIDSSNDSIQQYGTKRYPVYLRILINPKKTTNLYIYYVQYIQRFLPDAGTGFNLTYFSSNFYENIEFNGVNLQLLAKHRSDLTPYYSILNSEQSITVNIFGYFDVPYNVNPDFTQVDFSHYFDNSTFGVANQYFPYDEYTILKDLYLAYREVNGNSTVADQYSDLNTTSSQIHQNEQQWYNANSSAIEQTGLSNFRFSQAQGSGINAVLLQFEQVWAALGSWNLVYIFALLLSLGTFIIRHEPTTRVKQYRSSVAAERAERISYYGRKNAEARASGSSSTLKGAVRRRK